MDAAVRLIHTKVFDDQEITEYQLDWKAQESNAVECYNLAIDKDDDPRNIHIPESEGHCEVHGPAVETLEVTQPLKTRTVNIGSEENPKYATIGDYWDEEMHPYRLNPKYKEKVRMELDKMLAARIIEPVEESEWVSPMVVQEKKTKGEI